LAMISAWNRPQDIPRKKSAWLNLRIFQDRA